MANQAQWLEENTLLNYPFDYESDEDFRKLVIDFRLVLEVKPSIAQYRISALNLTTNTIEIKELISGITVFSGNLINSSEWPAAPIWRTMTSQSTDGNLIIVLKVSEIGAYSDVAPANTTIIDSTVEGKVKQVRRLFIANVPADDGKTIPAYGTAGGGSELIPIIGKVLFKGGYNTKVSTAEAISVNTEGSITISMAPGQGIGRFVNCEDDTIKTINYAAPEENGNLIFSPEGTLAYERTDELDAIIDNGLRIRSHSNPCCSCSDYIDAYTALKNEYDLARRIGFRLQAIRDIYIAIHSKLVQEKEVRETGLKIKTNLHNRPAMTVAIMSEIRNSSETALTGVTSVRFTFSGLVVGLAVGAGIVITGTHLKETIQIEPIVVGNTFTFYLGTPLKGYDWVQCAFQVTAQNQGSLTCVTEVIGETVKDISTIYARPISGQGNM